jgi:hypothetical protein
VSAAAVLLTAPFVRLRFQCSLKAASIVAMWAIVPVMFAIKCVHARERALICADWLRLAGRKLHREQEMQADAAAIGASRNNAVGACLFWEFMTRQRPDPPYEAWRSHPSPSARLLYARHQYRVTYE